MRFLYGWKGDFMKKLLTIFFVVTLLLTGVGTVRIYAEGKTVEKEGDELPSDYVQMKVTLQNDGGLYHHDGTYETLGGNGDEMISSPYTVLFTVDYFGKPLTAKVVVTLDKETYGPTDPKAYCKAYIDSENLLQVGWYRVNGAKVKWDVDLYDEKGNSYLKYFLFGFEDPDESDYLFDTAGRSVYYVDAASTDGATGLTAAQYYMYNGGFRRSSATVYKFSNAKFIVSIPSTETTFTFYTDTPDEGALQVPFLYSKQYNITYDLNDATGTKATPAVGNPDHYASSPEAVMIPNDPSRKGYTFLGWKEVYEDGTESANYTRVIPAEATGDKKFKAYWEPYRYNVVYKPNKPATASSDPTGETEPQYMVAFDEEKQLSPNGFALKGYTFKGWTFKEGEQSTVDYKGDENYVNLTEVPNDTVYLYAQWEPIKYKIHYNPNEPDGAPKATGTMADDDPRYYDVNYNLTDNAYDIVGYDFLGWSTVEGVNPVEYANKQAYINLVETDGSEVTMYAQWTPWTYTLKYDPNGGTGNMDDQIFKYWDDPMKSKENAFKRDGYRFVEFVYEYDGVKYHLKGIDDFVEKFRALDPYSVITLVAQWEKLPDPVTTYAIPVTGVE